MRTSRSSLAVITRRDGHQVRYAARWNPKWRAYHLVGGHRERGESSMTCLIRELQEEVGLAPDEAKAIVPRRFKRLRFRAHSRSAMERTRYVMDLYETQIAPERLDAPGQPEPIAWLTRSEILDGRTIDGEAVSPTMRRVLRTLEGRQGTGPLPLVIGVAGHRDLFPDDQRDDGRLAEAVRRVLTDLMSDYPQTPITVLSSLDEGADRLVARIGLELGCRLVVPLPMPREVFVQNFTDPESIEEFDDLLRQADTWFVLPEQLVPDLDTSAFQYAYEECHGFVADSCQILLALWDGVPSDDRGCTSRTIHFKRSGVPEPYRQARHPLNLPEDGLVFWIPTPHRQQPDLGPAVDPYVMRTLYPERNVDPEQYETLFRSILKRTDQFNKQASKLLDETPEVVEQHRGDFQAGPHHALGFPPPVPGLIDRYAVTDILAIRNQSRTRCIQRALHLIAMVAAVLFAISEFYSGSPSNSLFNRFIPLIYLVFLSAGLIVYRIAHHVGMEGQYYDQRGLAEGLRTQIFWRISGLRGLVVDHYLRLQRSELEWIRNGLRAWTIPQTQSEVAHRYEPPSNSKGPVDPKNPESSREALRFVLDRWVAGQAGFYRNRADRFQRIASRWHWVTWTTLVIGLFYAIFRFALPDSVDDINAQLPTVITSAISPIFIIIGLAPLFGGLASSYSTVRGYGEQAGRYLRMAASFSSGEKALRERIDHNRLDDARALIDELGKDALTENGDWILLQRERPIDIINP